MKKLLARQHAKDISEYTKQIMAKDKELSILKKKLGKVCVCVYVSSHVFMRVFMSDISTASLY